MKKLLLISIAFVLAACGGAKKTQEAINSGNYTTAINKALKELKNNKTKKGNQKFVLMLEEAFDKNTTRELEKITFLEKEGNPANLEKVYNGYLQLKDIQGRIGSLLPLPIYEENREANFKMNNYDTKILNTKSSLSEYLYANATDLLENASNKLDYRQAYDELKYLNDINPGYFDTAKKMDEAYQKGLDYVKVEVTNDTEQIIPKRLEEELLDFNTYGINNFWATFHSSPMENVAYDYALELDFNQINISPEQVNETQIIKEKLIKDGFEYVLDDNGNVAKDSLGNDIKVDKFKKVTCDFYRFTQLKTAQIGAKVNFKDLQSGQVVNSYPLSSEFIFEHIYANYQGDRRALDNSLVALLDLAAVPFPSNEQMVYDAGEDLKARLKDIVRRNNFN
ncbi:MULTISPECIES: hypothetical protein [Croceitalea]|uniref:Lipoprotein n=1 Tax=Croceitalea vernalis TaxID=3075599 RepID=A0ABU3BHX4_9FLAO|nr:MULTISPECIES: hypothetical protein [unclassified Croceitalea]MDT0539952.1 hypothetical protein [Croceitalea sp. P059]MDT0621772.1 hypothetical protein [Croceitalea sp. P007]